MVVRLQPLKDSHDYRRPLTTLFLKVIMVVRLQSLIDSYDNCRPLTTLFLKIIMVVPIFVMHANPLVEHTVNSARTNTAWDKYKTPISILQPPD